MRNLEDTIERAKNALPDVTPTPPKFKKDSSAYDLKARLEWGEPALTIIDVRDREAFQKGHITGAVPMPMEELLGAARNALELKRDIYIYGESDEQSLQAAETLQSAGFTNVAHIKGGLSAWREVAGPSRSNMKFNPLTYRSCFIEAVGANLGKCSRN